MLCQLRRNFIQFVKDQIFHSGFNLPWAMEVPLKVIGFDKYQHLLQNKHEDITNNLRWVNDSKSLLAFYITGMIGKSFHRGNLLQLNLKLLQHGAHATIKNQDSFVQAGLNLMRKLVVKTVSCQAVIVSKKKTSDYNRYSPSFRAHG